MSDPALRPLTADETSLLTEATVDNLNWCADRFTTEDVTGRPEFSHHTSLVPTRGDFGFVLELADRPIGVVWALFLPPHDRGYGYVAGDIPEVSIWVSAEHRGVGLGRTLLRRAQHEATSRGLAGLSLSVEPGNGARHLYRSEGFAARADADQDIMLWSVTDLARE